MRRLKPSPDTKQNLGVSDGLNNRGKWITIAVVFELLSMRVSNISGVAYAAAAVVTGITVRVLLFAQPGSRSNWREFFKTIHPRPSR